MNSTVYNTFNAENQWIGQSSFHVAYLYDGDGDKVKDSGGASGTRIYVHDVQGNVLEELAQNGVVNDEYVYLGTTRIARVHNFSQIYYYYGDHLGTARVITDNSGAKCYDADYFPWGGEQHVYVNTCSQNYKFTGKQRDPDMGVDYFGARFYKSDMSRFYSPDWAANVEPVPYAKLDNPQSLNLYTYVLDNPLTLRDRDGHCAEDACVVEGAIAIGSAVIFTAAVTEYYEQSPNPTAAEALSAGATAASQAFSGALGKLTNFFAKDAEASQLEKAGKNAVDQASNTIENISHAVGKFKDATDKRQHLDSQQQGIDRVKKLTKDLGEARGKKDRDAIKQELKKEIDTLVNHDKEIQQKADVKKDPAQ